MSMLYEKAGKALRRSLEHGSVKSAVYDVFNDESRPSRQRPNERKYASEIGAVLALASSVSKWAPVLMGTLDCCPSDLRQRHDDYGVEKGDDYGGESPHTHTQSIINDREGCLLAMIHDLVIHKRITGSGNLKRAVMNLQDTIKVEFLRKKREMSQKGLLKGIDDKTEKSKGPRYLRVDLSRVSMEEVMESVRSLLVTHYRQPHQRELDGVVLGSSEEATGEGDMVAVENLVRRDDDKALQDNVVRVDERVTKFDPILRQWPLLRDGRVVMMDRATCLSAVAARVRPGDVVLDLCASPGSKSLLFLSHLRDAGVLIAVDKHPMRFKTLVSRLRSDFVFDSMYFLCVCTHGDADASQMANASDKGAIKWFLKPVKSLDDVYFGSADARAVLLTSQKKPKLSALALCADLISDISSCNADLSSCSCFGKKDEEKAPQLFCLNDVFSAASHLHSQLFESQAEGSLLGEASGPGEEQRKKRVIISVDPSCSGSGLPQHVGSTAVDWAEGDPQLYERVATLAAFQRRALSKALSFPFAKRVLYSTCSLFAEENEMVVAAVLDEVSRTATSSRPVAGHAPVTKKSWQVKRAVKHWESSESVRLADIVAQDANGDATAKRRGKCREDLVFSVRSKCVYASPQKHQCRGFFLCKLKLCGGKKDRCENESVNECGSPKKKRKTHEAPAL